MSAPLRFSDLFRLPAAPKKHLMRLWLPLLMLAAAAAAHADALPDSVDTDAPSEIMTLWVVGDVDVIAKGLNAVAMFFNGMGSGSPLISLLVLGSVLALCAMLGQFITRRTMQPGNNFLMIVLVAAMFIPKTPVWIASYYDAGGGSSGGAVGVRKIDHVPVGVAYPLALFSYVSKKLTGIYDTGMQVLPDSSLSGPSTAAPQGGILTHGAEGYFSPLKTVLRLRNQFSGPDNVLLLANLANASRVCNWSDRWGDADKGGIFNVLARGHQSGVTNIALPGEKEGAPPVIGRVGCDQAGKIISLMMLKQVANLPGKDYSPTAVAASNSRNLAGVKGNTTDLAQRYKSVQEELDQLPSAMALAAGGNASRSTAVMGVNDPDILLKMVRSEIERGELQPTALAQAFTAYNAVNAAEIEANMVFSHIVQQCLGGSDTTCARQAYMMTEARNRAAVDAAGEASLYQNFMGHSMNILMFIYIVMSPVIIFVVLVMGWGGIRVLSSYLLFAAWVNSWLPLNSAIAYYMLQSYNNRMRELIMTISASDNPLQVYSPSVIQGIFDGTQDMLASASTMMASTPLIMLSLLSGSVYGLVQLAQRANMVGKDYVDETKATPPLDQSEVIGMSRMIANSSAAGPLTTAGFEMHRVSDANANHHAEINLQADRSYVDTAMQAEAAKIQMLQGAADGTTLAKIGQDGIVTQSGLVYAQNDKGESSVRFAQQGDSAIRTGENFVVGAKGGAGGSAGVANGAVSVGANGTVSSDVSYTDSNGETHTYSQGKNVGSTKGIQTAYGTMDSQQLSHSITQQLSDARERSYSLSQASSESLSNGFSTRLDQRAFSALLSANPYDAHHQLESGANAAAKYDQGAAAKLHEASGNAASYFSTLANLASSPNAGERSAAYAAIHGLAKENPAGHAQAYAQMADGALAVEQHRHDMPHANRSAIDQPISTDNLSKSAFANPIDHSNLRNDLFGLNQSAYGDPGHAASSLKDMSPEDERKLMTHNYNEFKKMVDFNNQVIEKYNLRSVAEKAGDYALVDAFKTWDMAGEQWEEGKYGEAVLGYTLGATDIATLGGGKTLRRALGKEERSSTGLSEGLDPQMNDDIKQMEKNLQRMKTFNPNDMSRTLDGTPIEKVIGHKLQSESHPASNNGQPSAPKASAAADYALTHAHATSHGQCAEYVNNGLQAQGIKVWGHGKDVANNLLRLGWERVPYDRNYVPRDGDVLSFAAHGKTKDGGGIHGHAAIWSQKANGGKGAWVSDFVQNSIYPGRHYHGMTPTIVRMPNNPKK